MAFQARVNFLLPFAVLVLGIGGYLVFRSGSGYEPRLKMDMQEAVKQENVVPVAIVGSGPAGLSASLYIARAGMKAFVFGGPMPCGQLTQTTYIENWPGREKVLGVDLMHDVKSQAESFGACIINDTITKVDFTQWPFVMETEEGREFKALSVILATGALPKTLSVVGEKEFWGSGVTTCAVCDAPFFKGKEVVVIGGGDSAAEMVFELSPYVKKVTLLVRKDYMRAAKAMQQRIFSYDNVHVLYNKEVKGIFGENGHVTSVDLYDNKEDKVDKFTTDGVFLAIGHKPNAQVFRENLQVDQHGYITMQGRSQQTSVNGVFAAGEVQDPAYRQAAVAAGEGVKAALDAASFLYSLGFNGKIGKKLEDNFFETFSDERLEIQEISTLKEFEKYVINKKGLVVLDFYATTCPGCIQMLPSLESVAHRLHDKVSIIKCNIMESYDILSELRYNRGQRVGKVPAIFVFRDGKYLGRSHDLMSRKELFAFISKYMNKKEPFAPRCKNKKDVANCSCC